MSLGPGVPVDFNLVVPEDWARLRLGDGLREDVDRLVDTLTRQRPDRDSLAPELRTLLLRSAQQAHQDPHAVEVYLSMTRVAGFPLAASLAVAILPPGRLGAREGDVLLSVAAEWAARGEVETVELPAGPALRLRRTEGVSLPGHESERVSSLVAQYAVVVPGSSGCVMLSFGSPLGEVAEAMFAVFDAVAGSLRWVHARPESAAPAAPTERPDPRAGRA